MVKFTINTSEVNGFDSLKLPTEEVKLTEISLGRLGLLAIIPLLLVTLFILCFLETYVCMNR